MNKHIYKNIVEKQITSENNQQQFTDIHCHCLGGLDDGPVTESQSLALCEMLVADGVQTVIATAHQLGRFSQYNQADQIRNAVENLNNILTQKNIDLAIVPGADVRVDERIFELLKADKILTLADGGKYLLLELPHEIFIDIDPLLIELSNIGITVIVSHPERHTTIARHPQILTKWFRHGIQLQVTAASLLGEFGPLAKNTGWELIKSSWAALVATDAHDCQVRKPCMSEAYQSIIDEIGQEIANQVCITNPELVLTGQEIQMITRPAIGRNNNERMPSSYK